jgi:O-antigen ligase
VNSAALKTLLVYAVILPLAVFVGWMVAGDIRTRASFTAIMAVVFVLSTPLLLRWHYPVLVLTWNTFITIFFLPGQPSLWMLMAFLNVGIALLHRVMTKRPMFISAPAITGSLLFLLAVVLITAQLRGGIGLRIFGGGTHGGKGYIYILAAIVGYFALASRRIPREQAKFYIGLFLLPALLAVGSNLIYYAGDSFYFLFAIFPIGFAAVQAQSELGGVTRLSGIGIGAMALAFYLVAVRGIGGLLQRWWRVLLLIMLVALTTISGYRSTPVLLGLVLALLFVFEGQFRSPRFLLIAFAGLIALAMLLPFTDQLPRPVQRSLTFLPVKVDPAIRRDAQGSTEWRVQMWQALVPDLPKYLWLGKGYALHPLDLYLTQEAMRRSLVPQYQGALVAGDYHSGPLSVYIPFGSFGALAFLVFLGVSIRALYRNYRYGDPEMRNINRFLLAYFCARAFFYLFAFGSFNMDLYQFTGIMGLSVALNHGVCRRPEAAVQPLPARVRKEIQMGGAEPSPA